MQFQLHADVCAVYTKFLSGSSLNLPSTPNSSLSGRIETTATAAISPSGLSYPDTTKSPLRRPLSGSLLEQNSPADLHCTPVECSPERAQMASSQGLMTPSKSLNTSSLLESPRRTSSRLTPAKRVISDSCLPESSNNPAVRLPKSPKAACSPNSAHGSPRRPSTRSLASDANAASVVLDRKSPRKPLNSPAKSSRKLPSSPAKSPRKLLNSPAKSPRKILFSPAKTSTEVRVGKSPQKRLLKSPKKTIDSEGLQSQQAMSRSDLRR